MVASTRQYSRFGHKLGAWVRSVLLYIIVIITSVIAFFPLYWMCVTSMLSRGHIFVFPPAFLPPRLSLASFAEIMEARPLLLWFGNTLLVTVSAAVLALFVSTFGAYSLSRFRYRGRLTIITLNLITQMLPAPLLVIPLYVIFRDFHLLDTYVGLIAAYTTFTLPLCIWTLKGFFDSVPVEIEEAAMIDGCSHIGALFHIVLPLSLPGLAATTLFALITGWNEFILPVTLINSQSKWVMGVGLSSFIGEYLISWNQIAAAAIVMVLPIVVAFAFLQQYLIGGLASGGLKG
ncbi:MAG: carbohydrate ABC transporter permease [Chloroflexi bacterium]|nr:carbohydrate ABC transporter permease [Chloroflexota bacterium]MCL5075989.1 carbohydrate ABC transporter permease [Chloroflexota bacterium]